MTKFSKFYMSQKDRLFGYLLRRTGNYQLSADIMQESFTKYMETYAGSKPNPALLFAIGRNLLVDQFRRQRADLEFDESAHYSDSGQEERLLIREEYRRVLDGMQQLSREDADILSLVVGSDLSYKEISRITGISVANVKIRVHRARLRLKKILQRSEL